MPYSRNLHPVRRWLPALLLGGLLISMGAQAASCRAYSAADIGSQAGYDQAKKAADAWAQRETRTSNTLQQCLGDISTMITVPVFPSLTKILQGIEQKVCTAGRQQIEGLIPDDIDPWNDLSVGGHDIPTTSHTISAVSQTPVASPSSTAPGAASPFSLY